MTTAERQPRSPLAAIIGLAPSAAFGAMREMHRAAFGLAGMGTRLTIAAADVVFAVPPFVRASLVSKDA